jgi:hypothetical protein
MASPYLVVAFVVGGIVVAILAAAFGILTSFGG